LSINEVPSVTVSHNLHTTHTRTFLKMSCFQLWWFNRGNTWMR